LNSFDGVVKEAEEHKNMKKDDGADNAVPAAMCARCDRAFVDCMYRMDHPIIVGHVTHPDGQTLEVIHVEHDEPELDGSCLITRHRTVALLPLPPPLDRCTVLTRGTGAPHGRRSIMKYMHNAEDFSGVPSMHLEVATPAPSAEAFMKARQPWMRLELPAGEDRREGHRGTRTVDCTTMSHAKVPLAQPFVIRTQRTKTCKMAHRTSLSAVGSGRRSC